MGLGERMRGRIRAHRPIWRRTGSALGACTVLAAAAVGAVSEPGVASVSGPPPGPGAVSAAAGQVKSRAAQLDQTRTQLAVASARLATLRNKAEVIIERYDKAMVNLHQAQVAYQAAQQRLSRAAGAESASRRQVGALAAQDYEAGAGGGSMVSMLGNPGGPLAFFDGAEAEQQLGRQRDEALAQNQATKVVAGVFRAQAHRALMQEQAAARQAARLKAAIQAAIGRQQAAVAALQASTRRLAAELGAAKAHEYALQQAQRATRSAAPVQPQALAGGPVSPPGTGGSVSGWPSSYSLAQGASAAQGNIAANWALTQIGKPYQWGGAGPDTYDCSGLTMDAWAHAGVTLLHWTGYQWPSGPHIPIDQLRRGDLLFFATNTADPNTIHNIGIYIGNGQMVDAPYTGVDVRIDSIYQPGGLIGATRPAA
jgi:cell wall-associated NlpC family hydrolase